MHHILALDELEHRPIKSERFPDGETRIQYWQIGDVPLLLLPPNEALALIELRVGASVRPFATHGEPHTGSLR